MVLDNLLRGLSALGGATSTARSSKASLAARRNYVTKCATKFRLLTWPCKQPTPCFKAGHRRRQRSGCRS